MLTLPKDFRDNITRARGYLQRAQLPRTLENLSQALLDMRNMPTTRATRRAMEAYVNRFLRELSQHPSMRPLLDPLASGSPHALRYRYGKEGLMASVLTEFARMLRRQYETQTIYNQAIANKRMEDLVQTALTAIRQGERGRAKAFLLRAATEFDQDASFLSRIGKFLTAIKYYADAGKIFEQSIDIDHRNSKDYRHAIRAYMQAEKYDRAEKVFLLFLRRFGSHPRTWGRMAHMYLLWEKPDEALDFASRALLADKDQKEATAVIDALAHKRLGI